MKTKEEIESEIERLKIEWFDSSKIAYDAIEKVEMLKKELESLNKPKRWKPERNEVYWFVNGYNGYALPSNWRSDKVDDFRYNSRNCFKTKEEAEIELERILFVNQVRDFIEEENDGWQPNWGIHGQIKLFLYYDGSLDAVIIGSTFERRFNSNSKVFKSLEIGEKILAKFDNEKLKNWWI